MGLQRLELTEQPGEAGQRVFQGGHLLAQGGGGGKGIHRHILWSTPLLPVSGGKRGWLNYCINNHTSMPQGRQVPL
ncbi:hypothetical protein D3C85_1474560 [compost metagenome]